MFALSEEGGGGRDPSQWDHMQTGRRGGNFNANVHT